MQIYVSRDLHDAVHQAAARAGTTASEWIRRVLAKASVARAQHPDRDRRYLAVRLDTKLQAKVTRGATAAGVTPSEWIRRALSAALEEGDES